MLKPVGAACNQACTYCYTRAPADAQPVISPARVDRAIGWYLSQAGAHAAVAWQGGEPLLAGHDHFAQVLAALRRHRRADQALSLAVQTNGALVDDAWAQLFAEETILVGLSLDGPAENHEPARGRNQARVLAALARLRREGIEPNLLCTLHQGNVGDPDHLWQFFVDQRVRWLQLIPIVEWTAGPAGERQPATFVAASERIGELWCRIFDLWFATARHQISVRLFDAVLNRLVLGQTSECTLAPSCAGQLTLMPGGELYACDHFVGPSWQIGAISEENVTLDESRLADFAVRKAPGAACQTCTFLELCHGGCPKHRPTPAAPSLLCAAYQRFFSHAGDRLAWLAHGIRRQRAQRTEILR
jgi:uncharacterized protein